MKSIFLAILFFAVSVIIPFYFYDILKVMVAQLGSGWVFASIYIRLLSIIFFAIGLYLVFQIIEKTRKIKFLWVFMLSTLPGFGISFIEPIYNVDYGLFTDEMRIDDIQELETAVPDYTFDDEYNLLFFGTTTCPHCKVTIKKLALNSESGQTIRVSTFFSGLESDATQFIADFGTPNFDVHMIEPDSTFLKFSGNVFPSLYLINPDGSTKYHWTGDMMNFTALDLLADLH